MEIFGLKYGLETEEETICAISDAISKDGDNPFVRSDINVGTIVASVHDSMIKEYINKSDIVNMDGMGAIYGARFLNKKIPPRVTGADLFEKLLALAEEKKYSVYFLGATEDVNNLTFQKALDEYPNLKVAGRHNGYFFDSQEAMVESVAKCEPDILFIGIKSPEKEAFIMRWKSKLKSKVILGIGGTFDVYSGHVERAPSWMQDNGLEWLFRVIQEPRRMWWRYAVSNSRFAWLLIKAKCSFIFKK